MKRVFLCAPRPKEMVGTERQKWAEEFYDDLNWVVRDLFGHDMHLPFWDFPETARGRRNRDAAVKNARLVIAVPLNGTWDGGADIRIAEENGVPIIVLCATRCFNNGHVPQMLLAAQNQHGTVTYSSRKNAYARLRDALVAFKTAHGMRKRQAAVAKGRITRARKAGLRLTKTA